MLLPHDRTLEKLLHDVDELIDCDKQFIAESEWLLYKWQCIARARCKRIGNVPQDESPVEPSAIY